MRTQVAIIGAGPAGLVQELAEEQAGGAGADDGDLGAHGGILEGAVSKSGSDPDFALQ